MSKKINVGLIGFGLSGQVFHAPFITNVPGLELKVIRETRNENIAIANKLYPETAIVNHSQDIFGDREVDLVVLATPNHTHYTLAKEALLAGKHVVVDKPFTTSTAEADELIRLSQDKGLLLSVYHNRRWDSDFKTIQNLLAEELLGDIIEYEAHFDRFRDFIKPNTWKEEDLPGAGILYDLGSHLIDQALTLFGLPFELSAKLKIERKHSNVVDNFELILYYLVHKVILKAGMLVQELGPRYHIVGSKGSFIKYGLDTQEEALRKGLHPSSSSNWGDEPESIWGTLYTTINSSANNRKIESEPGNYTAFYQNICQTVLGQKDLIVKPEQARNVIRIIELAERSNIEKRKVQFN
jgi:scyllo-inositol 2-dehydrogenase (NADP+)